MTRYATILLVTLALISLVTAQLYKMQLEDCRQAYARLQAEAAKPIPVRIRKDHSTGKLWLTVGAATIEITRVCSVRT